MMAGGAVGINAASAQAYENARFVGSVDAPAGNWGPSETSDRRSFKLRLQLSWPRELDQSAGTTTYQAIGGVVVCRGSLRVAEMEAGYPVQFAEKRRSPSVHGASRGKRNSIRRARSWCRSGSWRFGLRADGNVYSALTNENGAAPAAVTLYAGFANNYGLRGSTTPGVAGENRAGSRALKGPAFRGAKRCAGDVDVGSVIGFDVRVRNGSCSTAKRAIRKARFNGDRVAIKGWRCRSVGGYTDGGYSRCNRHRTTIQFGLGV